MRLPVMLLGAWVLVLGCQPRADESLQKSRVATVKFGTLEAPLRQRVFAKPENASLKEQYEASEARRREQADEMMKQFGLCGQSGKIEFDLTQRPNSAETQKAWAIREATHDLTRKELASLIESRLSDQYDVVIRKDFGENVLYSKYQVPDITSELLPLVLDDAGEGK